MYKGYNNVKIESFFDCEEYYLNPGGSTAITCTYARNRAEEFINSPGVNVLDIQIGAKVVHVIYTEEK